MPRIPQEKIDEVRNSVDIVDVVGEYLELTKKGREYVALCPFHDDHNPSMAVVPQKQIFYCPVCHEGGDAIAFVQKHLKLSYPQAIQEVARMGGVDMSGYDVRPQAEHVDESLAPYYKMYERAQKIYEVLLKSQSGTVARDYLHDRGFDDELVQTFGIGYAPLENVLYRAFEKDGYTQAQMVDAALVMEGRDHRDRYQDRIMFPLWDERGRVVAFSGRIYRTGQGGGKYVNSPETPVFKKHRMLYNYHNAGRPSREEGFVYICEGFMDVIAMHRAGHDNVIALMGTALTKDHIDMIRRLSRKVVLCLDGDDPGRAAALKACDALVNANFGVRLVLLPEGHDPDEILNSEGKEGLDRHLNDRLTPFDFMITHLTGRLNMNNYDDRAKLFDEGVQAISRMKDEKERDVAITSLAALTKFSREMITSKINAPSQNVRPWTSAEGPVMTQIRRTERALNRYQISERCLLYYMLQDKRVAEKYKVEVGRMYDDTYRVLASYIVDYYRSHEGVVDVAALSSAIKAGGGSEETTDKLVNTLMGITNMDLPAYSDKEKAAVDDYIKVIKDNARQLDIRRLEKSYRNAENPGTKAAIASQILALKKEAKL